MVKMFTMDQSWIHVNLMSSLSTFLGIRPTMTGSTAEKQKTEQEEEIVKELVSAR